MRIGNGAAFHQQFDIYGELMDGIYLYNKYGKPVTWEQWVSVREILGMISSCYDCMIFLTDSQTQTMSLRYARV